MSTASSSSNLISLEASSTSKIDSHLQGQGLVNMEDNEVFGNISNATIATQAFAIHGVILMTKTLFGIFTTPIFRRFRYIYFFFI